MKFTCRGSVRGGCGIQHRTLEAAERCCQRDAAAIRRAYPSTFPAQAYSDREIIALDIEAEEALRDHYET